MERTLDRTQRRKLDKRLDGIAQLLNESRDRIYKRLWEEKKVRSESRGGGYIDISSHMKDTGFQPLNPERLKANIQAIVDCPEVRKGEMSLDLGCGNGGFALMAAAAGFPSYGIDINPDLIAEAKKNRDEAIRRGLIDKTVVCEFATGSMYTPRFDEIYKSFVQCRTGCNETETMPTVSRGDAYKELDIDVSDAKIIYSFPWYDQMPVLCSFLNESTRQNAVFILPHYQGRDGIHGMELDLLCMRSNVPYADGIGKRKPKEKKYNSSEIRFVEASTGEVPIVDTSVFHRYSG